MTHSTKNSVPFTKASLADALCTVPRLSRVSLESANKKINSSAIALQRAQSFSNPIGRREHPALPFIRPCQTKMNRSHLNPLEQSHPTPIAR